MQVQSVLRPGGHRLRRVATPDNADGGSNRATARRMQVAGSLHCLPTTYELFRCGRRSKSYANSLADWHLLSGDDLHDAGSLAMTAMKAASTNAACGTHHPTASEADRGLAGRNMTTNCVAICSAMAIDAASTVDISAAIDIVGRIEAVAERTPEEPVTGQPGVAGKIRIPEPA
jgi:hypothetical protein